MVIKDNMKILFITSSPLHKMHVVDLYINEISNMFETEIWDVSPMFLHSGNSDFPEIPVISTLNEFCNRLDKFSEGQRIAVITNILIFDLHVVYKELRKRKIPIISIDKESIIFWMKDNYERRHPDRISDTERKKLIIKAFPILRQIYSYMEYQHAKFDYILGAYNYYPDSCRRFYRIHNMKYDEYLRSEKKAPVIKGKYILFMDAGLAHLPMHDNKPNAIDKQEYLEAMNAFFSRVESQFGMPVIIAAHPKSGYKENDFNKRPIILYKTPELVKYAELVLAHYSTSLIEVVLQKKKVIFMYSEDYMKSDSRTVLETASEYAHILNASFIDVKGTGKVNVNFDEKAYDAFIENHIIRREKAQYSNGQLIIDFLHTLDK